MNVNGFEFTEPVPIHRIRGIYLLWKNGTVVYVGQSTNIFNRVGDHVADPRMDFDSYSYVPVENGNLNELEADMIVKLNPSLNTILPSNRKYINADGAKRLFGVGRVVFRRLPLKEVWRGHYFLSEFLGWMNATGRGYELMRMGYINARGEMK